MAKESSDTLVLGDGLVPGKLGIGTLYSLLLGKLVPIDECLVNNGKFGGGFKTRAVGDDMRYCGSLTIGKENSGGPEEFDPLFFWG